MITQQRFGWLAWLVIINACLVAGSILHRHLFASEETPLAQPATAQPTTSATQSTQEKLATQEKLEQLPAPDISSLPPMAASTDDPLMQQIRKAASEQFPDLATGTTQGQQSNPVAAAEVEAIVDASSTTDSSSTSDSSSTFDAASSPEVSSTHDPSATQATNLVAPSAHIALLTQRLKATGQLNLAAQQLAQLAALQQQTLQEDQAKQTLAEIQQIQQIIIELLSR